MARLNLANGLVLDRLELNRLFKFLDEDGFRKLFIKSTGSFGVIKSGDDPNFNNFRVGVKNSTQAEIVNESFAVDLNGQLIRQKPISFDVPTAHTYYWVKIAYNERSNEVGTVNIAVDGTLTGSGTEFLSVLRGQANKPVKIRFLDSSVNTGDYTVVEVADNTNAIVIGDGVFTAEHALTYAVVGSFSPSFVVAEADKLIYRYDGCTITLVGSTSKTYPPVRDAGEYYIAVVSNDGSAVTVFDRRSEIWLSKSEKLWSVLQVGSDALIGVESAKWDNAYTSREKNIVRVGWGMRSSNWTMDTSERKITIVGGSGGRYKTTDDFSTGGFNGWRVYCDATGKYANILTSSKSGGQINLTLDSANEVDFPDTSDITVVPNAEGIEVAFKGVGLGNVDTVINSDIAIGFMDVWLSVPTETTFLYNVTYRYKNNANYTERKALPNDSVGYYAEGSFDVDGNLKPIAERVMFPYNGHLTNGYIGLIPNALRYHSILASMTAGDRFGVYFPAPVEYTTATNRRIITLEVGVDYQTQRIQIHQMYGGDSFIVMKDGQINGNEFILHLVATNSGMVSRSDSTIKIVKNYVDPTSYDTIYALTEEDLELMCFPAPNGLILKCVWTGSRWLVTGHNEVLARRDAREIMEKKIAFSGWNLYSSSESYSESIQVAHGLDRDKIVSVQVVIRTIVDSLVPLEVCSSPTEPVGGRWNVGTDYVTLWGLVGGFWDSPIYTNLSGWVYIRYEV